MFGKNIRHYRLLAGISQEVLAEQTGIPQINIVQYEKNQKIPDVETLKRICNVLDISISKLLNYSSGLVRIDRGWFRKAGNLSAIEKSIVLTQIECEINRCALLAEFVGNEAFSSRFPHKAVPLHQDAEKAAECVRAAVGLAPQGPVSNLLQTIENAGILVAFLDVEPSDFSGYCCRTEQELPVISINKNAAVERQRFLAACELIQLLFEPEDKCSEEEIDRIAGCFLLPETDIIRELGAKRKCIGSSELLLLCDEYGVSGQCAALRAFQTGIISESEYKKIAPISFPFKSAPETASRYTQLVYRAFFEGEIGIGKAAEMLGISLLEARAACGVKMPAEW